MDACEHMWNKALCLHDEMKLQKAAGSVSESPRMTVHAINSSTERVIGISSGPAISGSSSTEKPSAWHNHRTLIDTGPTNATQHCCGQRRPRTCAPALLDIVHRAHEEDGNEPKHLDKTNAKCKLVRSDREDGG